MRILIVDNGTKHLNELKDLFIAHSVASVMYQDIEKFDFTNIDAIFLSGGHDFAVNGNEKRLHSEINLIKNFDKPIFGICFGFELIARIFGANLLELREREKGVIDIQIENPDRIFEGISNYQVYESHRWVVKDLPDDLIVLARSKDGIEAFKHKSRRVYAVQFHPEVFVDNTSWNKLINNFLELVNIS
jgi:GMP synthase (glutamine-hydrolysing)